MTSKVESQKDGEWCDCRENYLDLHAWRCVGFTLIALGYVAALFVLQLRQPVVYVLLITEDSWIEYATFAGLAMAALLVGCLAIQPGLRHQRILWAAIAVLAAVAAMEEISWGQRILGFGTPELFLEINEQRELTLHNIEGANGRTIKVWLARGLVAWTVISVAALLVRRVKRVNLMATGLPFFPPRLWAFSLILVWLIFEGPFVRKGEINELAIALLGLIWAADLYAHMSMRPLRGSERLLGNRLAVFVAAVALTTVLTVIFPGHHRWQLNEAAVRLFPEKGLMAQSSEIFEYILANPQYIRDDTIANYSRLFPDRNDQ
jgi:hypothetical protein